MAGWEDLVAVALLGTDRRPVPTGLPPAWAGPAADPGQEPTSAVLAYAARHRAAVRAGSVPPTGPAGPVAPGSAPDDPPPGPPEAQQAVAEALQRGSAAAVNEALALLADLRAGLVSDHWTAAAAVAARNPRVDRALLAGALGVRGVWFVAQNPAWARLAAALPRPDRAEADA